jgi:hypothetical protein
MSLLVHMNIIGIGHKARRGKDAAAIYLSKKYELAHLSFAASVYNECRSVFVHYKTYLPDIEMLSIFCPSVDLAPNVYVRGGHTSIEGNIHNLLDLVLAWITDVGELTHFSGGCEQWDYRGMKQKDSRLLQWYGNDYRRELFGHDYWINKVDAQINELSGAVNGVVLADMRYKNEARYIKYKGGTCWKVHRDEPLEDTGRDPNHISEIDLDNWNFDYVIHNDKDLINLYVRADECYLKATK